MAIVINGSGTVTGLSVGGLPDGTVDTDTLASSSVTEAKLATDSVVTGKIADGTIANADINSSAAIAASKVNGEAAFSVKLASSGSLGIANATATTVPFAVEEFDSDGVFNTSTYKFTAPSAGKYYFYFVVRKLNFTSARFVLDIYKNTTAVTTFETGDGSSVYGTVGGSIIVDLAQNDTMHAEVYQNQGNTQSIDKPNTRFFGFKLIGV